jgi:hypothetical protein
MEAMLVLIAKNRLIYRKRKILGRRMVLNVDSNIRSTIDAQIVTFFNHGETTIGNGVWRRPMIGEDNRPIGRRSIIAEKADERTRHGAQTSRPTHEIAIEDAR